jgi:hypothetical protein
MIEPEIGCTFESTKVEPKEAVRVVWVTGQDDPDERLIMVGHQDGVSTLTMKQWNDWCDRVGAKMWDEDYKRLNPPKPEPSGLSEDHLRLLAYVGMCSGQYSIPLGKETTLIISDDGKYGAALKDGGFITVADDNKVTVSERGLEVLRAEHWPAACEKAHASW